jgi:hypothetical protein
MTSLRRYLYGWWMFARAVWLSRTKKRGAGRMPWSNAMKMGAAYRYIVDGQNRRPPRIPRYLRRH